MNSQLAGDTCIYIEEEYSTAGTVQAVMAVRTQFERMKNMTIEQLIQLEIDEMNRHKWLESEKAGRDLGDDALLDWIEKHEDKFIQERQLAHA